MYPSLSTRRRLLLALLILGGKSSYSRLKTFLPADYSGPKFYAMLKRLESEGLIRRSRQKRQKSDFCRIIRFLPAGIELLERRHGPRIRRLQPPDIGYCRSDSRIVGVSDIPKSEIRNPKSEIIDWSLIILNFPTSQAYSRSRLAGRLLEFGCRPLRDGVYVSHYPILSAAAEWAEENNCLDRIFLLSVTQGLTFAKQRLGLEGAVWGLPVLSRRYLSLLDRLNISKGISLSEKRKRAISRIKSDFLDLVVRDPLLPEPLLPADYPLARILKVIASPELAEGRGE